MFLAFLCLLLDVSTGEENLEPWLGRRSLIRRGAPSIELLDDDGDLISSPPDPPELSLHFAHDNPAACNMEEADAFWQTHPFRRTPEKMVKQIGAMRALREVKRIFTLQSLPLILVGDMLLGWRRGCFTPEIHDHPAAISVATFGPWLHDLGVDALQEAFHSEGHRLDASGCRRGALMAGCRLNVKLTDVDGSTRTVDVGVFLSAPPSLVGRRPGLFPRCASRCGENCEQCRLAWPQLSKVGLGRFYACPLPVADFRLMTWMNDTFWMPSDPENYLAVEYGDQWSEPSAMVSVRPSCLPSESSGLSFSPYQSFISSLPHRHELMRIQRAVEKRRGNGISEAASAESQLWEQFFHTRTIAWSSPVLSPQPTTGSGAGGPEATPAAAPVPAGVFLAVFGVLLSAVVLRILAGMLCRSAGGRRMAPITTWAVAKLGQVGKVEVMLLACYVFVMCARILLQRHAATAGQLHHSGSNALAASVLHAVVALGLLSSMRSAGCKEWPQLCRVLMQSPRSESFELPLWLWMLLAGALQGVSLWLSFISLSSLDVVSYTLLSNTQAFLATAATRQQHGVLGAALVAAAAGVCGGSLGAVAALGQVITDAVAKMVMDLAESSATIDILQACQYSQGVLVLFGILWLSGEPFQSSYWEKILNSLSMPACVACMCSLNLGTAYLLKEVPSSLMAMAPGLAAIAMLVLARYEDRPHTWGQNIQVLFSLAAALLHAMERAPKPQPQLQAPKTHQNSTLRSRPPAPVPPLAHLAPTKRPPAPVPPLAHLAPTKRPPAPVPPLAHLAPTKRPLRPPPPMPPRKWSSSNSSEVGSTTASNSHSEHGESDCELHHGR